MTEADQKTLALIGKTHRIETRELDQEALRDALEAGMRSGAHQAWLNQHPSNLREQQQIEELLGWLSNNDRNGLWGEYLTNYIEASEEHGALDLESLMNLVLEMKE